MQTKLRIDKRHKISLKDFDPADILGCDKERCIADTEELGRKLYELQEWFYAAQTHSVLIVLQGMDTSGKDGTISHAFTALNPQGCAVASFKVPTPDEASHDFLWRVHKQTPTKGMITIFNRSHYEDVLVTRVHGLIDKKICENRYENIRDFEKLLTQNHTIVLKFFLNISKSEQEERLLAREQDASKAWKLSAGDWKERKLWDDYQNAYEDAISETSTEDAPWHIIPANHKWVRNYIIAKILVDELQKYRKCWEETLKEIGEQRLKELTEMRAVKNGIGK